LTGRERQRTERESLSLAPRRISFDPSLLIIVVMLAAAGVAVSTSARAFEEARHGGMPLGLVQSLAHIGLGFVILTAVVIPDYRRFAHPALIWLSLVGISGLLVAALFSPEINNTHRWLTLFGLSIQPSELAKPLLVVATAATLSRDGNDVRSWSGLARPLLIAGWLSVLVLAGRDLGTPVLLSGTALAMIFAAGARWAHAAVLASAGSLMFALGALLEPYRIARVTSFVRALKLEPGVFDELPHQLAQSLLAIGSGGVFGKGFGSSTQKAFFLPEADNDFVFSIIAEELGLLGGCAVIVAFMLLAWRGVRNAERSPDELGRLIALGATWLLVGQAVCHIGVAAGVLPTKGLPLPFLSTGGSSMLASFALAGLLMNVSLRRIRHGY
jgi:cell division protein FtsW